MGGALHLTESSIAELSDLEISENQAETNGGAIHNDGRLSVEQSSLSGNRAGTGGGAIINKHTNAVAEIEGTVISGNSAENGAGVAAYHGSLAFIDCEISENTSNASRGWGGGFLDDSAETSLTRVSIERNYAYYGGGFSINGSEGRLTLTDSRVEGNSATDGRAFVNFGTVNLEDSRIVGTCNNHATINDLGETRSIALGKRMKVFRCRKISKHLITPVIWTPFSWLLWLPSAPGSLSGQSAW